MLDEIKTSRINTDASVGDLGQGEYRDALNISLVAHQGRAFTKGTTYGNIDTNIIFNGLSPDAICLGTAIDTAGKRMIVTFYQQIPVPNTSEYQGVINYATSRKYVLPSPAVQAAQNYLIVLMKQDGIWDGLDVFYCFYGDGDSNFARINWKLPNDDTTARNNGSPAMTYAVNSGFKGNGSTAYLDTLWLPGAAVNFTLDNASFVIGAEEIFLNASGFDGVKTGSNRTYIGLQVAANSVFYPINSATESPGAGSAELGTGPGLYFAGRSASNVTSLRKNTGSSFAGSIVSSAEPTNSFYIGALHDGVAVSFNANRYSLFAAGEYLNTADRETKFYTNWMLYKNSFVTPLITDAYAQEVLMYLLPDLIAGEVQPLVKSSNMRVTERSYLDGYAFVNEQFYFNFRESAPKVINIQRALDSPGFYDNLNETSLTVIKPHPPFAPDVSRQNVGAFVTVNSPIQKKAFQFMMIYRFLDGEQSTKSPASKYINSMDHRDTEAASYSWIAVGMIFPPKDYAAIKEVELYVRNNNAIADWRSVNIFPKTLFTQRSENYDYTYIFLDNVVGNFLSLESATKLNDAVPQLSNYMAFLENRIFMIDSLIDYDFTSTFQIKIDLDANTPSTDDRVATTPVHTTGVLYTLAEFEYDSEYSIGIAFYDKYGRKYPATVNDKKLLTPRFIPTTFPLDGVDRLPKNDVVFYEPLTKGFKKSKITAKYDLRAAGNVANYGKPAHFAYWWAMIRGKNTRWEFQKSAQCLLRFPYSITKWPDTDPANFPFAAQGLLFLEDGYLYWDAAKLLTLSPPVGDTLINDYIDIVIPPSFPYPLDNTVLVDFMMTVTHRVGGLGINILDREVIEIIANKIRIRGDRNARWFSTLNGGGQYRRFPKFTTGVNLTGTGAGAFLYRDETTFPIIIKRRRTNNLESIIMYDTPVIYPVRNPGTRFCSFQAQQGATIERAEFAPAYIAPALDKILEQGDILVQPVMLTPTTVAFNHAIKVTWGTNTGDSLRLKIKVSLWQLNDLKQPILELYSATEDAGGPYYVKDGETIEYLIDADAELINGWYGYGLQILSIAESNVQFQNEYFDNHTGLRLNGWENSGDDPLLWKWFSVSGIDNVAFIPISVLGTGWSKPLYQYLYQTNKNDLTVEVIIEGVDLEGPPLMGAITQYPSDAGVALPVTGSEPMVNKGRNIVPYFIDCPDGRIVTLNTLNFTTFSVAAVGTKVTAEIWRLNQTTKAPTTMITGSDGTPTALAAASGSYSAPFGSAKIIDTTGWYGIALYLDAPAFSDFTDKNYNSGAAAWTVKAGSPPWVYQGDTAISPVYGTPGFAPPIGSDQGYKPLITMQHIGTPIFIPTGTDPTGYDQWTLFVGWGDNIENGWDGRSISVCIWEVDQVTKRPTTYTPAYVSTTTIKSSQVSQHLITGTKLLGNKWYMFGLGAPSGHLAPTAPQFTNPKLNVTTGWTIGGASGTGTNWVAASSGTDVFFRGTFNTGVFSLGGFAQYITGYVRVFLPSLIITGNLDDLTVTLKIGGVVKQVMSPALTAGEYFSVLFDCFYVWSGSSGIEIVVAGAAAGAGNISVLGIMNVFNPYYADTPKVRHYAASVGDNESWRNFGAGVLDPRWKLGTNSWSETTAGQVNGARLIDRHVPDAAISAVEVSLYTSLPNPNSTTGLYWGNINMGDVVGNIQFNHILTAKTSTTVPVLWEVYVFNTLATFDTTGVQIASIPWNTSGAHSNNYMLNVPGGYRYIGYRVKHDVGAFGGNVVSGNRSEFIPQVAYNSWYKTNSTMSVSVQARQITTPAYTQIACFHADNIAYNSTSAKMGQPTIIGTTVRANIEIVAGQLFNDYDLILYDNTNVEIGRQPVNGQALSVQPGTPVNPQITVSLSTAPTTAGLFLAVQNRSTNPITVRIRQITNLDAAITLASNDTIPFGNAKTWRRDALGNNTQLGTTTVTSVDGTDNVSLAPEDVTVVLADASGVEISAPQTFVPNTGPVTLIFSPNLQVPLNYNYGIKVKNGPTNSQTAGTIQIHSMLNVASNEGEANIIANTINPAAPLYEAWNQFSLGAFARAGYVSNFIAVVSDLVMGPFIPTQIEPTSYHVVHDVVPAGIIDHSTSYGDAPDSPYNYGVVYPSISSDPDAAGIVHEEKTGQSIGDINIKITDQGEKSHSNIVRWSDPIIVGTSTNNLNAFLDSNKYAVDFQRGQIQVMQAMHDHTLFCVHEQGMSSLYVQRSVMSSPAEGGQDQLFLTSKVVGTDNKLTSNLGTVNPESVRIVESGTLAYGFDLIRKSFWQKSNNGIRNLTYECNAKNFFSDVCYYRLKAYHEGEDIKIYTGYNEKQKSFYLTFAPFIYRGQPYPAVTVAYNVYIDGFISRYSFAPISYLATEDVIHTIKSREMNNADFFGDFRFWKQNDSTGTAIWFNSITSPGNAQADTSVAAGTRILNPDFSQGSTYWSSYGDGVIVDLWILADGTWDDFGFWEDEDFWNDGTGAPVDLWVLSNGIWDDTGSWEDADVWKDTASGVLDARSAAWIFTNDGVETTITAGDTSNALVNAAGAPGTYLVRVRATLPVTGLTFSLYVFSPAGAVLETLLLNKVVTGDNTEQVSQTQVGRIGMVVRNTGATTRTFLLRLFSTVVKTQLLYQPIPVIEEPLQIRIVIPEREGSIYLIVYAFNDPESPFQTVLYDIDLIRLRENHVVNINVQNTSTAKYIGLYTITDYDVTLINYFNVNSVPSIWAHDQSGRTNNFYGVQYDSAIELVFSVRDGQVCIFNSVGIESETAWSVERMVTSKGNMSALAEDNFRLRNGIYSAAIMRDVLTPQDALPDPVNGKAIMHGAKMTGTSITMILRNSENLRQIELSAVYLGSEELAGNLLAKK